MAEETEDWLVLPRPCEDCGGRSVSGLEPADPDDNEAGGGGQPREAPEPDLERSEWCTNLQCPSNHALRGLHRVGVGDYLCLDCNEVLRAPISEVFAHRGAHRGQPDQPDSYTYG